MPFLTNIFRAFLGSLANRRFFLWIGCWSLFFHGCAYSPEHRLIQTLMEQQLWQEARSRLESHLAKEPANAALHNNLAICLEALGERATALEHYKVAAALEPRDAGIRENLQRALAQRPAGPQHANGPPDERP